MTKTGIIILHWHNAQEVTRLVQECSTWNQLDFEFILVDNSGDYNLDTQDDRITVTSDHANLGFAGGCNYGIKLCFDKDCEHVLLLNADIAIQESDVIALQHTFNKNENLAAIAPILKEYKNGQTSFHKGGQHPLEYSNTRLIATDHTVENAPIAYLPGTVLLLRRGALEEVGLLDEDYFFSGEIADWFLRLARTKWKFNLHLGVTVEHFNRGNESYRKKHYIYYSLRNRYLLIRKFGEDRSTALANRWTKQLRRQMIGALVRFKLSKFMTIYHAVRDGLAGRFGKSAKF